MQNSFHRQFLLFLGLAIAMQIHAQTALPPTPARPVTETYFGQSVTDPYRWLENTKLPEVQGWLKQQNAYARAKLAGIPGRDALLRRMKELDKGNVVVASVALAGERIFYFKREPGQETRKLYVRDSITAPERRLADADTLATKDIHFALDWFVPAIDGAVVAYGISVGGSEESVLHVLDASTGKDLGESIDRAQFASPSWLPGSKTFLYTRQQKLSPDSPAFAKYQRSKVYIHRLGADPEKDQPIFGFGYPGIQVAEDDLSFVAYDDSCPYVFGLVAHGVKNEITLYMAPLNSLNKAVLPWTKIVDVDDEVTGLAIHSNDLYLLTHKGASRFKILQLDLKNPNIAQAETAVPPSDVVLKTLTSSSDALYVESMDGGPSRLQRLDYATRKLTTISLPFSGAVSELAASTVGTRVVFQLESWVRPPQCFQILSAEAAPTPTELQPMYNQDTSAYDSLEVKLPSKDGTLVPLSIIFKKGIKLDGSHPVDLDGYGAYGISITPAFSPQDIAWLEKGGVLAEAHVRGGGEYGEDWHTAGQKLTKQHTVDDFLACGQWLVDQHYTSPKLLNGEGTSAGGILIGGAVTQRPDLFSSAFIFVGDSDALRSETMVSGPANIPEFGTVKDPDGFKGLFAMDAYQHVKTGTAYPAVLLTGGANDPRVEVWESAKMAARLQAATSSGKPVLLRVAYDEGHGIGSTRSQRLAVRADAWAFALWQDGIAGFQPTTADVGTK